MDPKGDPLHPLHAAEPGRPCAHQRLEGLAGLVEVLQLRRPEVLLGVEAAQALLSALGKVEGADAQRAGDRLVPVARRRVRTTQQRQQGLLLGIERVQIIDHRLRRGRRRGQGL